ncbi:MAG: hypothetical protein QOF02_3176 [Blastocatellia bacterium]|jgi:hypothetical protein|nr:hypothetical protein [Blastocatellia bacterium]
MELEMDTPGSGSASRGGISLRTDVFFLPEFYSNSPLAGRSDQNSGRRKVGSLSDTQDLEGTVRKLATGPGAYFAECRAGRDLIDSNVFELKPKGQSLEIESSRPSSVTQSQTAPAPQAAQQPEASSAQSINATTETIRATKELLKEVAPPAQQPAPPQLTEERIAEIVAREFAKHAPQPTTAQPDPFAFIERALDVTQRLQPKQAERADSADEQLDKTVSMFDKITQIAERISPQQGGGDGWMGGVASILNALGAREIVPTITGVVANALMQRGIQLPGGITAGTPGAGQPNGMHPQGMTAPPLSMSAPSPAIEEMPEDDDKLTFEGLMENYKISIVNGETPEESINDTVIFIVENPEFQQTVEQILNLPNGNLLMMLSQATGANLSILKNADKFIDGLKKGVRARLAPAPVEVAPVAPSANGSNGNNGMHTAASEATTA